MPETLNIAKAIGASFYVNERGIYELGFDSDSTFFIFHSFESKSSIITHEILIDDQLKLIPLKDDIILKRVVHLPSCPTSFAGRLMDSLPPPCHSTVCSPPFLTPGRAAPDRVAGAHPRTTRYRPRLSRQESDSR